MYVANKHMDVDTYFIPVPLTSRVVKAYAAVDTEAVASAAKTLTFSDGTNTIGVITTGGSDAEGVVSTIVLDATTEGKVALGPATPLKVVVAGAGNGEFEVTIMFDEFHADN